MDVLFRRRGRAYLRDCVGYLGIAAAALPVGLALRASGWTPGPATVWAMSTVAPVVATVLAAHRESTGPLATPGKRRAGLRVVDPTTGSSTFGHCLLRNVVKIAIPWQLGHTVALGAALGGYDRPEPVLVVVTLVTYAVVGGLLVSVLRTPGRGWHDRVARTRVVVGPSATHSERVGG